MTAPWHRVFRFVTQGGARGHSAGVIEDLIRAFEKRRFEEENRVRRETVRANQIQLEQRQKEQVLRRRLRLQRQLRQKQELDRIRTLSSTDFEVLIADLYRAQGYEAFAVGGGADQGIDVNILKPDGITLWAIAQCKRYSQEHKVSSSQIREFAGSYRLAGAEKGFYFTTSEFTRNAQITASQFSWLTIYNGMQLAVLIRDSAESMHF